MTIEEVKKLREEIGCGTGHMDESRCDVSAGTTVGCLSLTDEQVFEYVARYGCICSNVRGPVCPHCKDYHVECDGE